MHYIPCLCDNVDDDDKEDKIRKYEQMKTIIANKEKKKDNDNCHNNDNDNFLQDDC